MKVIFFLTLIAVFFNGGEFETCNIPHCLAQNEEYPAIDSAMTRPVRINVQPENDKAEYVKIYVDDTLIGVLADTVDLDVNAKRSIRVFLIKEDYARESLEGDRSGYKDNLIEIPEGYFKNKKEPYIYPPDARTLKRWSFSERASLFLAQHIVLEMILLTAFAGVIYFLTAAFREYKARGNFEKARLAMLSTLTQDITDRIVQNVGDIMKKRFLGALYVFVIVGYIGMGGMGVVLKGCREIRKGKVDADANEIYAIKVITEKGAQQEDFKKRFIRETRILGRLDNSNIVKIIDSGEVEDVKLPFIAMEYLEGESLRERIRNKGKVNPSLAAQWTVGILRGLSAAHSKNIYHRDLKPENIFITRSERVKILDFGIAKEADADSFTRSGTVGVGTPRYAAPEQIENFKHHDHRADLFSAGVILYEMLTGEYPMPDQKLLNNLWKAISQVVIETWVMVTMRESYDIPFITPSAFMYELG